MATVVNLFQNMLAKYDAEKVIKAFQTWLERSQEFPTPADIINLIKRNGKPPLKESDIIAIRKKDGEDRTHAESAMLREWEEEQQSGWIEPKDPIKQEATDYENTRLRVALGQAQEEIARLGKIINQLKREPREPVQIKQDTLEDKIARTIEFMKANGAPEEDIREFERMH